MAIDVSKVPNFVTDSGYEMLEGLKAIPEPEIVKTIGADVSKLATITADDAAKLMPVVFENDFYMASKLVDTGKAVCEAVEAIGKVDRKAGLALGAGMAALVGVCWLYSKVSKHEARIQALEQAVGSMQSVSVNAIGF